MPDIPHEIPRDVALIDWPVWIPTERAVLCFARDHDWVLLINKKTGLGAGKVNAPGGRIDPGESAMAAAIREVKEEVLVDVWDLREAGQLFFQFTDGYKLHGTVFFAAGFAGTPTDTPEAGPFWCRIDELPYDRMWEDDRHWLPLALAGAYFRAYFVFDGDRMLSKRIVTEGHEPVGE
ncbi:MAG: NUDIX domain-containing protein [Chitinivibrionales bacterium]|nr:NUDIX domain-containing protein [Chitinivibrionales bacterium]